MSSIATSTVNQNTLEIRFSEMPPEVLRRELKSHGFAWSSLRRLWFARITPERKALAQSLSTGLPREAILEGDCTHVMRNLPAGSVDLVVTDPPYLVNYKDRSGRSILGDNDDSWVKPAFAEMYRVLKQDRFCVSFCGWNSIAAFIAAAQEAGFMVAGHIIWQKRYASSTYYLAHYHEQAIVLGKGQPRKPATPLNSVQPWTYSGNKLHPTEKHVDVIAPLINTFSRPGDVVLDPFCGSGTTLLAARNLDRAYIGIERDPAHTATARSRLMKAA